MEKSAVDGPLATVCYVYINIADIMKCSQALL